MLIDPKSPLNNAIIFYIILIILVIVIKPKFIYNYKINKFKPFGYDDGQTLFPFPFVCISGSIMLYMLFSVFESVCD